MIHRPMKAARFLAVLSSRHLPRPGRRLSRAMGIALCVLLVMIMVRAAQVVTAGPGQDSALGHGSLAASRVGAVATPAPTAGATPSPIANPIPAPNLSVPEQIGGSTLLLPKPGAEFWTGNTTRNEIYITMDDCQNWDRVDTDLETAQSKGVHLTIFPAGKYIDSDRAAAARELQKAVAYGDEIDNHTYTHTFVGVGATVAEIKGDLDAQILAVRTALNDPTYQEWFVRTPYGSGMDNPHLVTAAARDGLSIVRWSIDTKGYEAGSTVQSVMHNVFETNFFKPGAIILMHDDITDMQALPLIIDKIREKGFEVGGPLKNILINDGGKSVLGGSDTAAFYPEIVMGREDGPLA
jgi:peptidoglycan/xylan/chitin deacetylase (PgdA/CDA1 family)